MQFLLCRLKRLPFILVLVVLYCSFTREFDMRPLSRSGVSKRSSARSFRSQSSRTKAPNLRNAPMRGGWRL